MPTSLNEGVFLFLIGLRPTQPPSHFLLATAVRVYFCFTSRRLSERFRKQLDVVVAIVVGVADPPLPIRARRVPPLEYFLAFVSCALMILVPSRPPPTRPDVAWMMLVRWTSGKIRVEVNGVLLLLLLVVVVVVCAVGFFRLFVVVLVVSNAARSTIASNVSVLCAS